MSQNILLQTETYPWQSFSGPLPFRMTSDYLFKFLLQSDTEVLKALICAYLDISIADIRKIQVTNSITLSDNPAGKEMILDIKSEMNDDTIINLEMQVLNNYDWPERSISYLCRCFDNLQKGHGYHMVKAAVHIGFLDYTLFPESPEFFAKYRMQNEHTGQLYTGKFLISVVDLKHINLATEEDTRSHRDLWARFFKAETWEDLKMITQQDPYIKKAVTSVYKLSEDERFRQQYEAREDFIRQQLDHDYWYDTQIKLRDDKIAEQDIALAEKNAALADRDAALAEQAEEIARLKKLLEDRT
jgi:predicted transposase/invertase (TIGR01784 family)